MRFSVAGLAAIVVLLCASCAHEPSAVLASSPSPSFGGGTGTSAMPAPARPTAITTGLPAGLRGAALDATDQSLLVLSRADGTNAVTLSSIEESGTVVTIDLPGSGADWEAGSVAAGGGTAWVSWGDHLIAVNVATHATRTVPVPWTESPAPPDGRSASLAVVGSTIWVAVIGEAQVRGYDTETGAWTSVATPDGRAVTTFTRLVTVGSTLMANLGAAGTEPSTKALGGKVAWVGEDELPVSDGVTLATISDTSGAILGDASVPLQFPPYGHAIATPTAFNGTVVYRALFDSGRFILDEINLSSGADQRQTVTLPTIQVPSAPLATGETATTAVGWPAPQVDAVVSGASSGTWVVTEWGQSAPESWGTVIHFPSTS